MDGGSPYNAVHVNNKKKHASNPSHSMDEPQAYSNWKKPDPKDHILFSSISKNAKS